MLWRLVAISLILAGAWSSGAGAAEPTAKRLYSLTHAFMVRDPVTEGEWSLVCSAVPFGRRDKKTLFVTAAHCLLENHDYGVARSLEAAVPDVGLTVLASAADEDVAVLAADLYETDVISLGNDPEIGDAVWAALTPGGIVRLLLPGTVAGPSPNGDLEPWWLSVFMPGDLRGSSGSGIVCESQGALCGVFTGTWRDFHSFAAVVPISVVKELLHGTHH